MILIIIIFFFQIVFVGLNVFLLCTVAVAVAESEILTKKK